MSNTTHDRYHVNFYCPLTVRCYNPYVEDTVELEGTVLAEHEDIVRAAVQAEVRRGNAEDMTAYFYGNDALWEKLLSVRWDIENVGGEVYGCIRADLALPLTDAETEELRGWIDGQCSDGWGEGFEQHPVDTPDGELYISFWDSGDDWFLLGDEAFAQHLSEQCQGMGGLQ